MKTKIKGIPSMDVSSIKPSIYGKRFLTFMQNKVFTDDKDIANIYKNEFVNHLKSEHTNQEDSKQSYEMVESIQNDFRMNWIYNKGKT